MVVDMFERRFRQELERLPRFNCQGQRVEAVWRENFPAWRAIFTALCLLNHSAGYRLPSQSDFFRYCEWCYVKAGRQGDRFRRYFEDSLLREGMLERMSVWYESGMSETYLYVCLVEAIEDRLKRGLVLYDARADWKLKADLIVLINRRQVLVSAFTGELSGRPRIEARRENVERHAKRNTSESSQWGNQELEAMPRLEINRTDEDFQEVNGVRVFSVKAVNKLLASLYRGAEIINGPYILALQDQSPYSNSSREHYD